MNFAEESLARKGDEQVLFTRLEDLAVVDKVRYTGPPPRVIKNPTGQGAGNPVILTAYTFFPRKRPAGPKLPLVVLVHGGVHGNFNSSNVHVLRELLAQGYAGVPVCDLVARMGYKGQGYRDLFSAPYHIGKTAEDDVNEYRRRSPAWNAEKLQTPLLIHTTTNDEDVNVLEVEHLIKALKAAGRKFEHKVYKDAPGGHEFNRIDTKLARESRAEVYRFLAKHLNPPNPVK